MFIGIWAPLRRTMVSPALRTPRGSGRSYAKIARERNIATTPDGGWARRGRVDGDHARNRCMAHTQYRVEQWCGGIESRETLSMKFSVAPVESTARSREHFVDRIERQSTVSVELQSIPLNPAKHRGVVAPHAAFPQECFHVTLAQCLAEIPRSAQKMRSA
jgi:hypothetical protein